jgi:predicted nucleic acid-binding protein
MPEGLLDTNVFIHAQTSDALAEECRRFLLTLMEGTQSARLEPVVVHELSYTWLRVFRQATRQQVADYILTVLGWPGVTASEENLLASAVRRWRDERIGSSMLY